MKVGRNDPCLCGSGIKYKRCCGAEQATPLDLVWTRLRRLTDPLATTLLKFGVNQYGRDVMAEAWREFSGYSDEPFDPDSVHLPIFMPWFFYHWTPDPQDTRMPAAHLEDFPLAGAYLRERGTNLDPLLSRYIKAGCETPFSFFDVVLVSPGSGLTLRDILRGEETEVIEKSASRTLTHGDVLFAKIVAVDGVAVLEGCAPVAFPPTEKRSILELRKLVRAGTPSLTDAELRDWDFEMLDIYREATDRLLHPSPMQVCNTDGDPLAFCRVSYEIPSVSAAIETLRPLALDGVETEELDAAIGAGEKVELPWLTRGNAKHSSWETTVLGRIVIDGTRLVAEVNSEERALRFRQLADDLLPEGSQYIGTVLESEEWLLAEATSRPRSASEKKAEAERAELNARPEVQAMLTEHLREHYREWLNIALPALGGITPLQAMSTSDGREMVEALLVDFERRGRRQQPPLDDSILSELRTTLAEAIPTASAKP